MPSLKRTYHALLLCLFANLYLLGSLNLNLCSASQPLWTDGTHELIARAHRITADFKAKPAPALKQPPQLGEQREFYAVDFSRSASPYFTTATCRAIGSYCYIFVEDSQWQNGTVTNTGVVRIRRAFDTSTPADPNKGIYSLETSNLGEPPDEIDNDPKIYILILDIPDGYNSDGTFVAGYFEPINQKRGVVRNPITGMRIQSNEVEMIYLDADPLDLDSEIAGQVLAHEFQHLIHWRHDPNEDLWVNEGCSDYASLFLCGYEVYGSSHMKAFEDNSRVSLVYWSMGMMSSLANYGSAYLWMVYLHEHYGGVSTISSIISQPANGITGINSALSSRGYSQRFNDIFADWKIANYLDDTLLNSGKYGYKSQNIKTKRTGFHYSFPVSATVRNMQSWSADYIEFSSGDGIGNLQIEFNGGSKRQDFDVKAILISNGVPVSVEPLQDLSGIGIANISISGFGYAVDTVVLVPSWQPKLEIQFDQLVSYSYSARLGDEIGFRTAILPNAINERYVDILIQLQEGFGNSIPRITVARSGKTVVSSKSMTHVSWMDTGDDTAYVYQLYIPYGWNFSEIGWEISYAGRTLVTGNLGDIGASFKPAPMRKRDVRSKNF